MRLFKALCSVLCYLSLGTAFAIKNDSVINLRTKVPSVFIPSIADNLLSKDLIVPSRVVRVAQVKILNAELRDGPGPQYKVKDTLLSQDQWLVLFQRVENWYFAIEKDGGQSGWVHQQALTDSRLNHYALKLPIQSLPLAYSARLVKRGWSFHKKQPVSVDIPKGIPFKILRIEGKEALVWIKETNSMLWLPREQVY